MLHVPAGLACAVLHCVPSLPTVEKAWWGLAVAMGGERGIPLEFLIKRLKFEFTKSSSLFLEK